MKSKVIVLTVVFFAVLCAQVSGQDDLFTQLQNNIFEKERLLNRTSDWWDKLEIYDDIIDDIDSFLHYTSTSGQIIVNLRYHQMITEDAAKMKTDWTNRRQVFDRETDLILGRLYSEMEDRAVEMALKNHWFVNLSKITEETSSQDVNGNNYIYIVTFKVEMKGSLVGLTTDIDYVTVRGEIYMPNNTYRITGANIQ